MIAIDSSARCPPPQNPNRAIVFSNNAFTRADRIFGIGRTGEFELVRHGLPVRYRITDPKVFLEGGETMLRISRVYFSRESMLEDAEHEIGRVAARSLQG